MLSNLLSEALGFFKAGQLLEAEACYRQVLNQSPENLDAAHYLGSIFLKTGRPNEAIPLIQRVLVDKPELANLRFNLALAYFQIKNFREAISHLDYLTEADPDNWKYPHWLAMCAQTLYEKEAFIKYLRRALELNPLAPDARTCMIAEEIRQSQFVLAACEAEQWSRLPGQFHSAQIFLAEAFFKGGMYETAEGLFEQISNRDSHYWFVRGYMYYQRQQMDEAIACYKKIQELSPVDSLAYASARANLGLVKLAIGQMAEGWNDFNARFIVLGDRHVMPTDAPEWDGRDLNGETVLVHSEQGLGDVIQFMRFFKNIEEQGGRVLFTSYPDVIQLLKSQQGAVVLNDAAQISQLDLSYQWQIPLLNLGKVYAKSLDSLAAEPYVSANPERVSVWQERLGVKEGIRVGLVWAGNPTHNNDANRSAALDDFSPLGCVPGARFFGLQKGPSEEQACSPPFGLEITSLSKEIKDFADTAAIISELDLVICVDTSVAHLAGALGKPVWVLLPREIDWRWLLDREDSPWYPSMRLFRLEQGEVWADLMVRVKAAFVDFCRDRTVDSHKLTWAAYDAWGAHDELSALLQYAEAKAAIPLELLASPVFKEQDSYESAKLALQAEPFYLGVLQTTFGEVDSALATLELVSDQSKFAKLAYRLKAKLLAEKNAPSQLEALAEDGVSKYPSCREFFYWRAQAARMSNQWERAIEDYHRMLLVFPRHPGSMINLAFCLVQIGRREDALRVMEKAVLCNKKHELAWQSLCWLVQFTNCIHIWRLICEHAVRIFPRSVPLLVSQISARARCGESELAIHDIAQLLATSPDMPDRKHYEAMAYAMGGAWDKAMPLFEQSIKEAPDNSANYMWLAQNLLRTGQWKQGWGYWEGRLLGEKSDSLAHVFPSTEIARWDGSALQNRTLLVLCEQGFGDSLNFLHLLRHIDGQVILVVQDGLLPLCEHLTLSCQVITRSAAKASLPMFDVAIELMSLPFVLGLEGNLAPENPAYVIPDLSGQRLLHYLDDLPGFRVGLVWAGNPSHGDTYFRDCPFDVMAGLLNIKEVSWCSLQKDEASNQVLFVPGAAESLNNIAPELNTWMDTATILSRLDLIITVDTALAHLAASMGRPVWLLISKRSDWRWGESGDSTIWYPSVRLFRQQELNNWAEVIHRVGSSLQELLARRG